MAVGLGLFAGAPGLRLHRRVGHRRRRDKQGTALLERPVHLELIERPLERGLGLDQGVALGPGAGGVDPALKIADLALHLLAGGQDVVDRLLAPVVDVGRGIDVGQAGGPLRVRAAGRDADDVGGPDLAGLDLRRRAELGSHRVAHRAAAEDPDLVLHPCGVGSGRARVEERLAAPALEQHLGPALVLRRLKQ
jgi:hypothetical protein